MTKLIAYIVQTGVAYIRQACGLSDPSCTMCRPKANGCTLQRLVVSFVLHAVFFPAQVYIFLGLPWMVAALFLSAVAQMIVVGAMCIYNTTSRHCAAPVADDGTSGGHGTGRQQRRRSKKQWAKVLKKLRRFQRSREAARAVAPQRSESIIKIVIAFVYAGMAACFLAVAIGIIILATWFFVLFLFLLLLRVFCIFQPPNVILHWCIQAALHAYMFGHRS